MDAAQVAEALSDHFGVEHTEADIIGLRADGEDTIAVTGFGNKVRISDGFVTVLLGPGTPVPAVVEVPEPEAEPDQPQGDLPPLQGVAADDANAGDGTGDGVDLSALLVAELRSMAEVDGIELSKRAKKAEIIAALEAPRG